MGLIPRIEFRLPNPSALIPRQSAHRFSPAPLLQSFWDPNHERVSQALLLNSSYVSCHCPGSVLSHRNSPHTHQLQDILCENECDNRESLLALTRDCWLRRIDYERGALVQSVFLSSSITFKWALFLITPCSNILCLYWCSQSHVLSAVISSGMRTSARSASSRCFGLCVATPPPPH